MHIVEIRTRQASEYWDWGNYEKSALNGNTFVMGGDICLHKNNNGKYVEFTDFHFSVVGVWGFEQWKSFLRNTLSHVMERMRKNWGSRLRSWRKAVPVPEITCVYVQRSWRHWECPDLLWQIGRGSDYKIKKSVEKENITNRRHREYFYLTRT